MQRGKGGQRAQHRARCAARPVPPARYAPVGPRKAGPSPVPQCENGGAASLRRERLGRTVAEGIRLPGAIKERGQANSGIRNVLQPYPQARGREERRRQGRRRCHGCAQPAGPAHTHLVRGSRDRAAVARDARKPPHGTECRSRKAANSRRREAQRKLAHRLDRELLFMPRGRICGCLEANRLRRIIHRCAVGHCRVDARAQGHERPGSAGKAASIEEFALHSGSCRDRARNAHGGVAGCRSGRRVGSASRYRHPQIKDQCPCPPPALPSRLPSPPPSHRPPRAFLPSRGRRLARFPAPWPAAAAATQRPAPASSVSAPALAGPSSHSARPAGSRPRRRICPLLRSSGSPSLAGLSAAIASGIPRAVRQRAAARRGPSRRPLPHPPPRRPCRAIPLRSKGAASSRVRPAAERIRPCAWEASLSFTVLLY